MIQWEGEGKGESTILQISRELDVSCLLLALYLLNIFE